MRLFVALDIEEPVRDYILSLVRPINDLRISFVKKENMHVTLKFLDEQEPEKIKKLLSQVEFRPFSLELNNIGFFPNANKMRVLWMGFKEDNTKQLAKQIDTALENILPPETDYKGHITIARIRNNTPDIKNRLIEFSRTKVNPLKIEINHFTLYSSNLLPAGPEYKKEKTFYASRA